MADTNPISDNIKICSNCSNEKNISLFIKNRNICKSCSNISKRNQYKNSSNNLGDKTCNQCSETKDISEFIKNRNICKVCNNNKRKHKYKSDEEHRKQLIQYATEYKIQKKEERHKRQGLLQEIIGINNKKCKYCFEIKPDDRFRKNRLKCKDCEREHPETKFIRSIRSRIHSGLTRSSNKKTKYTIEYLGCSMKNYFKWIMTYNSSYNLNNYGKEWHIDHVIPVSKFDLCDLEEQLFAFNWMNTMPLSHSENLKKCNKIINSQVLEHFEKIKKYHVDNNWEIPNEYINLYATYLDAGSS